MTINEFLVFADRAVDIDDFLAEEVKGPASFDCVSGKGCTFEEPAMNSLINDVFGDRAIYLDCESGECLHYTQVPGYTKPELPDNSLMVALSAAAAGAVFVLACICEHASRDRADSKCCGTWADLRETNLDSAASNCQRTRRPSS